MKLIVVEILGKPIAQARPRFTRGGHVYNPQAKEVEAWREQAASQVTRAPFEGPVSMTVSFWFERPKSHYTKAGKLKPGAPKHYAQKPDGSNLVKFAEDCLNGIAYYDDKQIVRQYWYKEWALPGQGGRTLISLMEVRDDD